MPYDRNDLRMALAQQLMGGTGMGSPRSIGAGLTDVGTRLAGAMLARRTMDKEEAQRKDFGKMLGAFAAQPGVSGQDRAQQLAAMLSGSSNPMAQEAGQQLLVKSMLNPREETFGTAQTVTGPGGEPALVQFGNQGTPKQVRGFGPKPEAAKSAADKWLNMGGGTFMNPDTDQTKFSPEAWRRELQGKATGASRVETNVSPTAIYKDTTGAAANPFYTKTGEDLVGSLKDATEQQKTLGTVQEINRTLEGIGTGPLTPTKTQVLKYAQQLGWKGNENEIGSVESAGELSSGLVLSKMKQLGGNDTEEERNFLQNATNTSIVTPQGRKMMEYIQQRRTARARKQAQFDGQLSKHLFEGNMDPADVVAKSQEFRNQLIEQDSKSWKPPTATQNISGKIPGTPSAPDAPKKWIIKNGKLVPE